MVPCWVWCDHYRGRYRQLKKVSIYRADPVQFDLTVGNLSSLHTLELQKKITPVLVVPDPARYH